jgi:hypothetical protein
MGLQRRTIALNALLDPLAQIVQEQLEDVRFVVLDFGVGLVHTSFRFLMSILIMPYAMCAL